MKNQIYKKQSWSNLFFSIMLIGFVFLAGCEKDPNNNTSTNTPVAQEDLSLNSYFAVGSDIFIGAYNSKIEDTSYFFEKKMTVYDRFYQPREGYSYLKYLKINWFASNKDGSRPQDTIIRFIFKKSHVDSIQVKSEEIPMEFDDAQITSNNGPYKYEYLDKYKYFDNFIINNNNRLYNDLVYVDGNWGYRGTDSWDLANYHIDPDLYWHKHSTASMKKIKLVDGKWHRVFKAEYYSYDEMVMYYPVKVRIVLD